MKTTKFKSWLFLVMAPILAVLLISVVMNGFAQASLLEEPDTEPASIDRDAVEVFTNTWSYSTIGLVYNAQTGSVYYAHESQSSTHNPTVYEIAYTNATIITPTVVTSFALSAKNAGWPWQIDNRTGIGYDYVAETYFLPDYNGDLSYADDNIVEITLDGTILNAWEMDGEVGSNDSSDGSKIDSIIDIAVVPGEPPRYFVTAAYDDNVVYEISLTRTGTWWTPNSWHTVATYTVPIWDPSDDNLGIDYDSENGLLYHSSWDTTTIVITDLGMNLAPDPFDPFDCPGAGGYNSGVTYIEGSDPPEVWVTDFSSDQTTRCLMPYFEPPEPAWLKSIDGDTWVPGMEIIKETGNMFEVTDVITAGVPFTLTELWDDTRLQIIDVIVEPPLVDIYPSPGSLVIRGDEATPETITINKIFLVQPSTWTETVFTEILDVQNAIYEVRPFTITKRAAALWINSDYTADVFAGSVAQFTLNYGNSGGYENDIVIENTFPITAPLIHAEPAPDEKAQDGTWASWDIGGLGNGDHGSIDVYVFIPETASVGDQVTVWDGIYNHVGELEDMVETTFVVQSEAISGWTKTIDGVSWTPGISVTKQTSETFIVVDVIDVTGQFIFSEVWDPTKLTLDNWSVEPESTPVQVLDGSIIVTPGLLPDPITLTKTFKIETCSWSDTILWEELSSLGSLFTARPVVVNKELPILDIDSSNPHPEIYGGETVEFVLEYSNTGGFENAIQVSSEFPAGISFVSADPPQTTGNPGDSIITWDFPNGLTKGQTGNIVVTVQVANEVPPGEFYEISSILFNHIGEPKDMTTVSYNVPEPVWDKEVNGEPWSPSLRTVVEVGDVVTVTEVITTQAAFELVETWDERYLVLIDSVLSEGTTVAVQGQMTWTMPTNPHGVATLTKYFEVIKAFTTTHTVVWEDLLTGGVEWERRPVILERPMPDLTIEKTVTPGFAGPGDVITYTLVFSNVGPGTATGVVITDHVPSCITVTDIFSSGVQVTDTGADPSYVWEVEDLAQNQGGVIVIVGILDDLPPGTILENVAEITAENQFAEDGGTTPGENPPLRITSAAYLTVEMRIFLPLVLR